MGVAIFNTFWKPWSDNICLYWNINIGSQEVSANTINFCWNKHFGRQEVSAEHTKYADVERNILEENRFQLITPNMLWNKNEKINLEPLSATVTTFFFPFFYFLTLQDSNGLASCLHVSVNDKRGKFVQFLVFLFFINYCLTIQLYIS